MARPGFIECIWWFTKYILKAASNPLCIRLHTPPGRIGFAQIPDIPGNPPGPGSDVRLWSGAPAISKGRADGTDDGCRWT